MCRRASLSDRHWISRIVYTTSSVVKQSAHSLRSPSLRRGRRPWALTWPQIQRCLTKLQTLTLRLGPSKMCNQSAATQMKINQTVFWTQPPSSQPKNNRIMGKIKEEIRSWKMRFNASTRSEVWIKLKGSGETLWIQWAHLAVTIIAVQEIYVHLAL